MADARQFLLGVHRVYSELQTYEVTCTSGLELSGHTLDQPILVLIVANQNLCRSTRRGVRCAPQSCSRYCRRMCNNKSDS